MSAIILFEEKQVRRAWNKAEEKWYFAIVDVIAVLTGSVDPGAYWRKLKERLKKDGNQTVTDCHALKMTAADGKQRMTDVADTEQLLRLIQSIPSPKAEPFKLWLAKVGFERLEEIENPELAAKRTREIYQQKGYSEEWIEKRMRGIAVRDELTDEWKKRGVREQREFAILTAEISKATFGMTPTEYKDFNTPYEYQCRLACGPDADPEQPDTLGGGIACRSQLINIPTGLGKTAAVVLACSNTTARSASRSLRPSSALPTSAPPF